jgi:hypothetical protein
VRLINKTGKEIIVPKEHTYQTVKHGDSFEVAEKDVECIKFLFPELEQEEVPVKVAQDSVKVEPSLAKDKKLKDIII